jgi:hypothetical protein
MITADVLVDLARRFLLGDGETIEWMKDYPDGPALDIETADRSYSLRVARDWLRIGQAPWVAAVVVAHRDDVRSEGPRPQDVFLVPVDGTPLHLDDPGTAAVLGVRWRRGDVDAAAYAEVLVQCHWPGGWHRQVVLDPATWRSGYPAEAALPAVEAPRTWHEDGDLRLSFFASREYAEVAGGRSVLDVAEWSVRVPADAPATWERRPVATARPLMPPW